MVATPLFYSGKADDVVVVFAEDLVEVKGLCRWRGLVFCVAGVEVVVLGKAVVAKRQVAGVRLVLGVEADIGAGRVGLCLGGWVLWVLRCQTRGDMKKPLPE